MILWALVLLLLLATVSGYLARWWWVLDLASHFRPQYVVLSSVLALVAALVAEPSLVFISLALSWANLAAILPLYSRRPAATQASGRSLRVFFHNVYERNHHSGRVAREARASGADVIALVETDASFLAEVRVHLPEYRYFVVREIGPRTAGVALLSRIQPERMELIDLGIGGSPVGSLEFLFDGARVAVLVSHTLPPHKESWFHHRNAHLMRLADLVARQKGQVVLVGDLNTTSWSSYFTEFARRSGLRDTRVGFGVLPTWPTLLPPLQIPIDHALISSGLVVLERSNGRAAGSDHRSLSVTVAFSIETGHPTAEGRDDSPAPRHG